MRRTIATTVIGLAVVLPLQFAMAGGETPAADPALAADEPAHQLLGDWRYKQRARVRVTTSRGFARIRTTRTARIGRCRMRRGSLLVRSLAFAGRVGKADVWRGTARWPDRRCRRRSRSVRLVQSSDLSLEVRISGLGAKRMRRVRPRLKADDPILGSWERSSVVFDVSARRRHYIARARQDFIISNGCRIEADTIVWRFRPLAPGRYDGTTKTFREPPGCEERTARSRWMLTDDGDRLLRETPDGAVVEYRRFP